MKKTLKSITLLGIVSLLAVGCQIKVESSSVAPIPTYTVTWKNYDGAVLEVDEEIAEGTTPTFDGLDPAREETNQYSYTWTGWTPELSPVNGDVTYTATFEEEIRNYTVTWKDDDGSVLKTEKLAYGTTPEYGDTEPTKESTAELNYSFAGWVPEIAPVTGDAEYTATYSSEIRKYTIIWKNYNDDVLEVDNIPYGSTPSYDGETPTKNVRALVSTFNGWYPEPDIVTSDMTYTAQYDETGYFSFDAINYQMESSYKLSDINGSPWINSNVRGEIEKIKKPSLKDDFYASVNYESLKSGGKGAFDNCDVAVGKAFDDIYSGTGLSATTNGVLLKAAYDKLIDGSVSELTDYFHSFDLTNYLSTKDSFTFKDSLLKLVPTENGFDVEFNDGYLGGYYRGDAAYLGYLWMSYSTANHAKNILKILSNALNLGLTTDDLNNVQDKESALATQAFNDYSRYRYTTTVYTVNLIPWAPMKSALLDLGLSGDTRIEIKRIYRDSFNTIYNNLYSNQKALLTNMILTRSAFDCRFLVGASTYKSVNQYIAKMSDIFENEPYMGWDDNSNVAKKIMKICFTTLVEQTYIELGSSEQIKAEVSELIENILSKYNQLADESWLGTETKARMKRKLEYMEYASCYSDAYKNFAKIDGDDFSSKSLFELYSLYSGALVEQNVAKEADKTGYFDYMHSWVVNAYYSPYDNAFVILNGTASGMLGQSVEEKYGTLAMVIGHEITHAFDSSGSQFDENGRYNDWWTLEDKTTFNTKVDKLIDYYNHIALKKNYFVNGSLINGEATADLGGMKVALMLAKDVDDFDYDKFFRNYANLWLTSRIGLSDVESRASDTHPFNYLRVNAVVSQFDEFIDTYDIKPGDGMYVPEEQRIKVW